jgi:hydrogenase maturation protease
VKKKILVLGIGNLLMGDEAIGIHIVREFESQNPYKDFVDVIDGGTGGFHLLSYLQDYEKIIIVDAAIGDKVAGTIEVIKPKYSSDFPRTLTAHDIGLKDLIDSAAILGSLPDVTLIIIYIDKFQTMDLDLSESVKLKIPEALSLIEKIINEMLSS